MLQNVLHRPTFSQREPDKKDYMSIGMPNSISMVSPNRRIRGNMRWSVRNGPRDLLPFALKIRFTKP